MAIASVVMGLEAQDGGGEAQGGKPRRLSDLIAGIDDTRDLSLGDLVRHMGERAFGMLMFIFAIPNVLPTPPGTSAILGLPLLYLSFRLLLGYQTVSLPRSIGNRIIRQTVVVRFKDKATSFLRRFEWLLVPRLSWFSKSDAAERAIGLVAFVLSLILFLPIPAGNIMPAAAIAVLALGLAARDGLAVLAGYALSAASISVLVLLSGAIFATIKGLIAMFVAV
jgi:hypothetical protein